MDVRIVPIVIEALVIETRLSSLVNMQTPFPRKIDDITMHKEILWRTKKKNNMWL